MKSLPLLAAFAFTSLLVPSKVWPCSCKIFGDGGPRATMRHARAVFIGEVLGIEETTREQRENGLAPAVARLRVNRFWKGVKTSEINVSTEIGVICGPGLEVGQEYLVYAFGKSLNTVCTRTRKLEYAEEDLKALGPSKSFKPK